MQYQDKAQASGDSDGEETSALEDEDSDGFAPCCQLRGGFGGDDSDTEPDERPENLNDKVFFCIPITYYNTWVRLRTAYAVGTASFAIVSVALGASLQVFFSVFEGKAVEKSGIVGFKVIFFTPLFFTMVAILVDEMWDLCLDALDDPPLRCWRAFVLSVGLPASLIDGLLIGIIEIVPVVYLISTVVRKEKVGEFRMAEDAAFYMVGCQVAATILALIQLGTHILAILLGRSSKAERLAKGMDSRHALVGQTGQVLSDGLRWKSIDALERSTSSPMMAPRSMSQTQTPQEAERHNKHAWKRLIFFMGLCFLAVLVLGALSMGDGGFFKALFGMAFALMVFSRALKHVFPGLLSVAFDVLIGFFVFIAFSLVVFSTSGIMDLDDRADGNVNIFEPPAWNSSGYHLSSQPVVNQYPVCTMRWGDSSLQRQAQLSILDLVVFADAVYMNYNDEVESVVRNATVGTYLEGVEIEHLETVNTIGRWGLFRLNRSRVRILAIRGTTSREDAMGDADMYSSVKVMQLFNQFLPVISLYPADFTRWLVGLIRAHQYLGETPLWAKVVKTAKAVAQHSDGFDLIITGHSLGGALAIIAGAEVGSQAVAFSPPGQRFSAFRFGLRVVQIEKSVTVVKPRRDLVPEVDQQIGFTQTIECQATELKCHSIVRTACELARNCGDVRGRTLIAGGCT